MTLALILLQVGTAAALHGRVVVWGSTAPVANVEVELRRTDAGNLSPIATVTTEQGEFRFPSVPPGSYRLIGMRSGFTQGEFKQRSAGGTGSPIALPRGRQTEVTLAMAPGAAIAGRMTDRDGQPTQRASVQAFRISYNDGRPAMKVMQSTLTDDRGEYRLFWLPPGRYYVGFRSIISQGITGPVVANPNAPDPTTGQFPLLRSRPLPRLPRPPNLEDNEVYFPVYFPGTTDLPSATLLNVHAGEEIKDVNVTAVISRPAAMHVSALMASPDLPPGSMAVLTLTPFTAPSTSIEAPTLNNRATFSVPPGLYELRAMVQRTNVAGRVVVRMLDRDQDVAIPLASFSVAGHVVIQNAPAGFELQKQQVIVRAEPSFRASAKIGPDGTFRVEGVPAGDYQVTVSDAALQEMYLSSAGAGWIHVSPDGQEPLTIVLSGKSGEFSGMVVDDRQQSFADATVVLVPQVSPSELRLDRYKTAKTDANGRFLLRGIAPGDYSVYAWADVDTGAWLDPNFMQVYGDLGTIVHIAEGEKQTASVLVIQ